MILVALGSNVTGPWGSPRETLLRSMDELNVAPMSVLQRSTIIISAPFGKTDQPDFANAVVEIATNLSPEGVMEKLHAIEKLAGRERKEHWGPRTLDLDLLDYHGAVRRQRGKVQKALVLPHPGIEERSFVLEPIAEIAPNWIHPVSGLSVKVIIQKLYGLKQG